MVCTAVGVEDPAGWAQLVSLYNYPGAYSADGPELDTLFPLNSVIAIREPCLKMALAASHSHIRVDSPTDLVLLEPGSPLLKNVRWTTGERPLPVHTKTANEWKGVGDKHFRAQEFYGAIAGYSFALQRDPSLISVRLNRSLANLRVGRNTQAVEDARSVLTDEQLPSVDRIKALYRCAQAMYAEGKYAAAKKWYSKCISIDPTLADALNGIQRSDYRIKEQTSGVYDWHALFEQDMKSPSMKVDVAEFQGPIEKRSMSNRGGGRGIVASRTIMPGELLVRRRLFQWDRLES
jgi:tetratricopeptide (TPR) repeat protein